MKTANITIIKEHIPVKYLGEDKVEGLIIEDVRTHEKKTLTVKGIFPYIGADPAIAFLSGLVKTDENGYIRVDEHMASSIPGIFAAGDCIAKDLRQVVTACNDGAIAAQSAYQYIFHSKA